MKVNEGKIGRVFVLRFENGDNVLAVVNNFIREAGIVAGYMHYANTLSMLNVDGGLSTPNNAQLPPCNANDSAIVYEIIGVELTDQKTIERQAPAIINRLLKEEIPAHTGDHTHIIYVFNAELN